MFAASFWGFRNWEGIEHLLVLGSLLFHFLPEYLWTNGLLHLGVIVALFVGGLVEGIRIP